MSDLDVRVDVMIGDSSKRPLSRGDFIDVWRIPGGLFFLRMVPVCVCGIRVIVLVREGERERQRER